jgi:hypothetical protein
VLKFPIENVTVEITCPDVPVARINSSAMSRLVLLPPTTAEPPWGATPDPENVVTFEYATVCAPQVADNNRVSSSPTGNDTRMMTPMRKAAVGRWWGGLPTVEST